MRVRIENTEINRTLVVVRRYRGEQFLVEELGPDQSKGFMLITGQSLEVFRKDDLQERAIEEEANHG